MSHETRDLNKDGKVSIVEKVKDKLHLGHKDKDTYTTTHHTTYAAPIVAGVQGLNRDSHISTSEKLAAGSHPYTADSRDLNRDGHISTSEKLKGATGSSMGSGFTDARDLNRDGHISTAERLGSGSQYSAGFDSRDLNRDGHISTAERLATDSHMGAGMTEEARLRLHEEQLAISKREVGAGEVDIHKRVQQETVQQTIPVRREEVTVERHALHGLPDPGARIAAQDEVVRVPLFREEILTEKRIVPTEEVVVHKQEVMDQQTVGATLRSEYVETSQTGIAGGAFDARDTNRDGHVSMGEKLKSGMSGSTYNTADSRDLNRDGHVSMGEKLQSGTMGSNTMGSNTAFSGGRDLNRDGHVSMGEKLKTADMNNDGRVSMGEKIKAARG
jgi:uncharacterized protein (TIGR02271 family)